MTFFDMLNLANVPHAPHCPALDGMTCGGGCVEDDIAETIASYTDEEWEEIQGR